MGSIRHVVDAQSLLIALQIGITLKGFDGLYRAPKIKPRLIVCMLCALPSVLLLQPKMILHYDNVHISLVKLQFLFIQESGNKSNILYIKT